MAIIGNSNLWADTFPDDLIPDILDLVLSAWEVFRKPKIDDHEVPITKRFRATLRQQRDLVRLPVRIDREIPEDDSEGNEKGRIDLVFTSVQRISEDVYFSFECKRLNIVSNNGKRESLAKDYVVDGMMRYITSQYASGLLSGGMIGYIMNSDSKTAIKAVDKAIYTRCKELRISPPKGLCESSIRENHAQIKETKHILPRQFVIHHLFLPL
ncbi:hypothetical protein [Sphaerospermopsis torques-reginae]|uniref:Uncharacterized protein n=1 Tax=Sphaerospermopsis torques-reginae ITEP-024 TaxID=984208 RepID=A0ABX8X1W1_9CYAN|nr:hypothetical protein [Sphaerospermopsis torques-reginae]QYX32446.1 hypothetical protein K2F26_03350 [Sphaerospermopsis torques-reginae ITEP-024]